MCIHKEISLQVTNKLPLLSQISFPKLPSKWAPSWRHFRKKRGFCLGWVYLEILGFHVYGTIVFEKQKIKSNTKPHKEVSWGPVTGRAEESSAAKWKM